MACKFLGYFENYRSGPQKIGRIFSAVKVMYYFFEKGRLHYDQFFFQKLVRSPWPTATHTLCKTRQNGPMKNLAGAKAQHGRQQPT
jgi:hypothetical protein